MSDNNPLPSDDLDQLFAAPDAVPASRLSPVAMETVLPATSPEAAKSAAPDAGTKKPQVLRFEDFLIKLTPHIWVTPACLLANVAYFLFMFSQGTDFLLPQIPDLLKWGANYPPLTWGGEPWRLLTSIFMHCGVIHLTLNMWALWSAGRMFERLVGSVGFFIIYMASGIAGGLASAWWNGDVVSAGASGAIFGVLGAFASFIWNRADSFPLRALTQLRSSLAMCIGYNLLFGASIPGIDQAAHIGGLITGLILGLVLSQPLDQFTAQRRIQKNLIAAAISILALGALIIQHPPPPPDLFKELEIYFDLVPPTIKKFQDSVQAFNEKKLTQKQLADLLEKEILPPWDRVTKHMESLKNVPRGHRELMHQIQTQLTVREEAWILYLEALRKNDTSKLAAFKEKWKQAEMIERQLDPPQ